MQERSTAALLPIFELRILSMRQPKERTTTHAASVAALVRKVTARSSIYILGKGFGWHRPVRPLRQLAPSKNFVPYRPRNTFFVFCYILGYGRIVVVL